jgi:hypothetical protein
MNGRSRNKIKTVKSKVLNPYKSLPRNDNAKEYQEYLDKFYEQQVYTKLPIGVY